MPQFLSATTNTSSSNVAKEGNATTTTTGATTGSKTSSYRIHNHHVEEFHHHHTDEQSSDGEFGGPGDYSEDDLETTTGQHKNGTNLKINHMQTVSRTPKEHFSDQVGKAIDWLE